MGVVREIEVRQPVVDQVDLIAAVPELAVLQVKVLRRGDNGRDAVRLEQAFEEDELGIKVLRLWRVIHNSDAPQGTAPALKRPLGFEALDEARRYGRNIGSGRAG